MPVSNDVVRRYSGDDCRFFGIYRAPKSARLLTRSPEYWLHHMTHDEAVAAALQLQHDTGLMMTNLQILSEFVTSLSRMSRPRCSGWPLGGNHIQPTPYRLCCRFRVFAGRPIT